MTGDVRPGRSISQEHHGAATDPRSRRRRDSSPGRCRSTSSMVRRRICRKWSPRFPFDTMKDYDDYIERLQKGAGGLRADYRQYEHRRRRSPRSTPRLPARQGAGPGGMPSAEATPEESPFPRCLLKEVSRLHPCARPGEDQKRFAGGYYPVGRARLHALRQISSGAIHSGGTRRARHMGAPRRRRLLCVPGQAEHHDQPDARRRFTSWVSIR